jgi:seryl-tRNA synthetase
LRRHAPATPQQGHPIVFDLKAIRDNPASFDAGLKRRGLAQDFSAKAILDLDEKRRAVMTRLQDAQSRRNAASKDIGKAKASKDETLAAKLMAEVAALKEQMPALEAEQATLYKAIEDMLAVIPNIPRDDVPFGTDEKGNSEVRRVGTPRTFDFTPKQHFELGEALGLMDFETAGKVSGARFVFLKGALARLERALAQFMLDIHTSEFGYTEVNPPMLVRDAAMYGTANLPKFKQDLFAASRLSTPEDVSNEADREWQEILKEEGLKLPFKTLFAGPEVREAMRQRWKSRLLLKAASVPAQVDFWLIPTAEVSLTNLVREQILDEDKLPQRYTAHTPCFRSEAGAAGKDTRGMIRQHQFSKVELVSITTPETSLAEHERMTACAEEILKRLGLPFRTMLLCTGDMGFASQKTYDIEVWLPGQNSYREISSCSVCGDFQARRMGARYRTRDGKEVRHVHTLNGSGLAVGRTLIAVLENYQNADGSITIPAPLKPYMGGLDRIKT